MRVLIIPTFLCLLSIFSISYTKNIDKTDKTDIMKLGNITECELCEDIVKLITCDVKNGNKTYHDVVDLIEDLCKIIGGPVVSKECNYLLSELSRVEELIVKGYNATSICQDIHICPSNHRGKIVYTF